MLRGRCFASICICYLLIFISGFYGSITWMERLIITAGLLFLFGLSIFIKRKRIHIEKRMVAVFLTAVIVFGFSFGYSEWFRNKNLISAESYADGNTHRITALIDDVYYEKPYAAAYRLQIQKLDEYECSVGASMEISYEGALSAGDLIEFEDRISLIEGEYRYYHRSQNILLTASPETFAVIGHETKDLSFFKRLQNRIASHFETYIQGEESGYASALFMGHKDQLDGQIRLAYQRLGISHVLAVSGMHFSVMIGGFEFLLRRLTIAKGKRTWILMISSVLLAGICGFSGSVSRAMIMFCLYYFADAIGEKSDALTSLMVSAVCIVTVNPYAVYDAGLWLSVFSTLGIILMVPSMQKTLHRILPKKRKEAYFLRIIKALLRALICMIMMNITALFFTMPVTYLLYGSISVMSPLANLIFIPLTELILYLLILLLLFGWISPAAGFLGMLSRMLIAWSNEIAWDLSDFENICISIRYPFAEWILYFLIAGLLIVCFFRNFRTRNMMAVFCLTFVMFGCSWLIYGQMEGDISYLYLHTDETSDVIGIVDDGEVMLIDITTGGKSVPSLAVDTLSDYYQCEIDTYVITHLHSYHAGTLKSLSDSVKIHRILLPEAETEKEAEYIDRMQAFLGDACELVFYQRNGEETVSVGNTVVTLPNDDMISRSSHPVIFMTAETNAVGAWAYCGASSMEFSKYWDIIKKYRTVIFGTHGPKVKNIFDFSCLNNTELVVFTSEETANLVPDENLNGEAVIVKEEYYIAFYH